MGKRGRCCIYLGRERGRGKGRERDTTCAPGEVTPVCTDGWSRPLLGQLENSEAGGDLDML